MLFTGYGTLAAKPVFRVYNDKGRERPFVEIRLNTEWTHWQADGQIKFHVATVELESWAEMVMDKFRDAEVGDYFYLEGEIRSRFSARSLHYNVLAMYKARLLLKASQIAGAQPAASNNGSDSEIYGELVKAKRQLNAVRKENERLNLQVRKMKSKNREPRPGREPT